jgi:DNA polymerase-4
MDCFFAAVEIRDNPSLEGKPVAIAGESLRGVLCTCNYQARKFGLHAAMPTAQALKLCPKVMLVGINMAKYKKESLIIREVFNLYTNKVEPLSLDEAFLDVTHLDIDPAIIAKEIRDKIFERTKLTASAGIAPNKFLAKIASDWNKPNGQTVIREEDIEEFSKALPVRKICGVGKVTETKMINLNLRTCDDLRNFGRHNLAAHFGKFGSSLYELSFGVDNREVISSSVRKTLSVENTFEKDLDTLEKCLEKLPSILSELSERFFNWKLAKKPNTSIKNGHIKLKFDDFQTMTIEVGKPPEFFHKFWQDGHMNEELTQYFYDLLKDAFNKGLRPVRLIGAGIRFTENKKTDHCQLKLL